MCLCIYDENEVKITSYCKICFSCELRIKMFIELRLQLQNCTKFQMGFSFLCICFIFAPSLGRSEGMSLLCSIRRETSSHIISLKPDVKMGITGIMLG